MEHAARFEEVQIALPDPVHGLGTISAVVGIPEWWPTGARVAVVMAHGGGGNLDDPLIECLHRRLAAHQFLTVRFNFPFAEAGRRTADDSPDALENAYAAAISILGRDPAAAPAHLFLGGKGIGGRVAADIATTRLQVDGVFFMGYPLHLVDRPELAQRDQLYRIISPMLFIQGTRDRRCDLTALGRCLARVGAPPTLRTIEGADHGLRCRPSPAGKEDDESWTGIPEIIAGWMDGILQSR